MTNLNDFGQEYSDLKHLKEARLVADPIEQFNVWFDQALAAGVQEANAMNLATANSAGQVSSRTVLLKFFDKNGFVFFTNYDSPKAQAIEQNPYGCMLFWWQVAHRQIKIEGKINKLDEKHSDQYFTRRNRGSQLSAWASKQSTIIHSRDELEQRVQAMEEKFKDAEEIPRPDNWGGYILVPDLIEFWQGGEFRLHDRVSYRLENNHWHMVRLAP